ncbi:MAG TPA: FAD-dependent oxidoreductase [Solirubrobacteraceae bacterium]|nr:FAD-dependent oxidoreductase [Solirubrobacteraceae bacterium]
MSQSNGSTSAHRHVTIVGGGIAGLTAAIQCAEEGAAVTLLEAHERLGGRARSTDGPYRANLGPHALYEGPFWQWMREREILPAYCKPRLTAARLRVDGALRRTPPLGVLPSVLRLRGREAPVDVDFRTWAASHSDERTAALLSSACGVFTYHHDPGELSAAFTWPRAVRLLLSTPTPVRYPVGGWSALVDSLERRVRRLGVDVQTGARVQELPPPPVIVTAELEQARELLGERELSWPSGKTVCIDLGLRHRRGDPALVSDMDESGWIGRYSTTNPSIAPDGEELVQAQMPIRPQESADQATLRLERLLDVGLEDWRGRETWRRRQVMDARSGAIDMPGSTWRERPAVDRGDGVFLAGDRVAADGLLAEVSWASAMHASRLALAALDTLRPRLREVA